MTFNYPVQTDIQCLPYLWFTEHLEVLHIAHIFRFTLISTQQVTLEVVSEVKTGDNTDYNVIIQAYVWQLKRCCHKTCFSKKIH